MAFPEGGLQQSYGDAILPQNPSFLDPEPWKDRHNVINTKAALLAEPISQPGCDSEGSLSMPPDFIVKMTTPHAHLREKTRPAKQRETPLLQGIPGISH